MGTRSFPARGATALALALSAAILAGPARADRITHATAVFSGLDKITGRIISFDVAIDETVQFGSLQITPRVCYTRPQTETPQTDGFIEVDEVGSDNQFKRIFSGWMFAASPGLHGVEHPVYDVWLTDCKGPGQVIASAPDLPGQEDDAGKGTPTARAAAPRAPSAAPGAAASGRIATPPGAAALPRPPSAPTQNNAGGPVEVGPPPGSRAGVPVPPGNIPNAPRRKPVQQYFPTTSQPVGPGGY